jgi:hypothetical protein
LASEAMALQAASGLVNLMAGQPISGAIKDSTVAQISAAVFYKTNVMAKLTSNLAFQNAFRNTIFNQVEEDFGNYVDAKARTSPRSLHHVYEWGKVGNKESRLFKLNKFPSDGLSLKINYDLLDSTSFVPSKTSNHRHVFIKKASIMEEGKTVVISPRSSERLVFEINGYMVFMPKGESVTVTKPGGVATKNSFLSAYKYFFTGPLINLSIKKSGFQRLFNSAMSRALSVPVSIKTVKYKFSPNSVASEADAALLAAFTGVANA